MADELEADAVKTTGAGTFTSTMSHDEPTTIATTESLDDDIPHAAANKEPVPTSIEVLPSTAAEESRPINLNEPSIATKSASNAVTIEDLPNELLSHIFGLFDTPRPSANLVDEPSFELTVCDTADLKASSCVSKRWREAILPVLFKHARFVVQGLQRESPTRSFKNDVQPFMEFVAKNTLENIITTFVIVVKGRMDSLAVDYGTRPLDIFGNFWRLLFKFIDPVELLIIAHPVVLGAFTSCRVFGADIWNFDCPCHYLRLRRPSALHTKPVDNDGVVTSVDYLPKNEAHKVVEPITSMENPIENTSEKLSTYQPAAATSNDGSGVIEDQTADVLESSVSKSEELLAELEPSDTELEPEQNYTQSSTLFEIRPWSSLLLNEGSFIKAYSTYEFWLRRAPSILSDMVGAGGIPDDPPLRALISPTIRQMSYIGIFPTASHFSSLTRHLPRLDSLYVQLVPRNNILEVPSKMVQVETQDLWMERNSCYALLMRELFNAPPTKNYKYLQIFESGDAADKDAWHMAVEYVKRAGNGWKVAGDGVFVKDPKDLTPELDEGDGRDQSSFEGALIRWAWNGITRLPVPASLLYGNPLGPVD